MRRALQCTENVVFVAIDSKSSYDITAYWQKVKWQCCWWEPGRIFSALTAKKDFECPLLWRRHFRYIEVHPEYLTFINNLAKDWGIKHPSSNFKLCHYGYKDLSLKPYNFKYRRFNQSEGRLEKPKRPIRSRDIFFLLAHVQWELSLVGTKKWYPKRADWAAIRSVQSGYSDQAIEIKCVQF